MNKNKREQIRLMFGGKCSYCGRELNGKWHVDHMEPVERNGHWVWGKWVLDGTLRKPGNHREDNMVPACVKCNILKSNANVEQFRSNLAYFARSIPTIKTYSHVHHLMRFGKITIDPTPVVFWFEKYEESKNVQETENSVGVPDREVSGEQDSVSVRS